ncbi:cupredoxin domain-containing protein [Candidatus Woesearchaeota archaeon]|nr:cupredoxin domain-containing protein [Candidatus Woesearchaeota archaeon]
MKKELLYIGILTLILVISGCGTGTSEEETIAQEENITKDTAAVEETTQTEETIIEEQLVSNKITGGVVIETIEETPEETTNAVKEFTITAVKFGYTPSTITVSKGDTVHIIIDNADGMHGMKIPELGISGDEEVTFVAEEAGTFTWRCNNFCGTGHKEMSGTLIVEE